MQRYFCSYANHENVRGHVHITHSFFIPATDLGGRRSVSCTSHFIPSVISLCNCSVSNWVGHKVRLNTWEEIKIPCLWNDRLLSFPARSPSSHTQCAIPTASFKEVKTNIINTLNATSVRKILLICDDSVTTKNLWFFRRDFWNCSPAARFANCVMTLNPLKVHLQTFLSIPITQKCQILSCDNPVTNVRYNCLLKLYLKIRQRHLQPL